MRPHDLIRARILQHAVLVDAGFVREGVASDDRLVGLHRLLREACQELTGFVEPRRVDPGVVCQVIGAHAQRHHDFLERRVPRALANAVDRALHLTGAALDRCQAVGGRQAKVVVAVRAEDGAIGVEDPLPDVGEERFRLVRRAVADRVRQIDRRAALANRRLDHAAQEVRIAARRVLGRKLHIVGEPPGQADGVDDRFQACLARDAQLGREMQIGGGEKRVNARPRGRLERVRRLLDVLPAAAGERRNRGPPNLPRHLLHRFGVRRRSDGEARLDDVDAQRIERLGQCDFRRHVHRESRRLLAVAQGRVENDYTGRSISHAPVVAGPGLEVKVIMITI